MKKIFIQTVSVLFLVNCILGLGFVEVPEERFLIFENSSWIKGFLVFGTATSILTLLYILLQAVLSYLYKPRKRKSCTEERPSCTILIPAYNEGAQVFETIESVLQSNFPAEKMEIIAIDDGSADDTWHWIQLAVQKYPDRVRGLQQKINGGKKRALCRGIAESSNEIIVTVDSDSCLEKNALENLLIPFSQDPEIGAAAGNIRVKNIQDGLMPRMLDVAFVFGCDFMRSAQSVIGSVLCTPGAISAYRRSAILPLINVWLSQTFLKVPSLIGEDRALTSLLLRNKWKVVCQNNAVAYTEVPTTYVNLCKMLLRWTRGDVRESFLLLDYVFSRFSLKDWRWLLFQVNILSQIIGVLLPLCFVPCIALTFFVFREHVFFTFYYTFAMTGVWSLLPAAVYARRTKVSYAAWAFVYGLFSVIALSWICIYSLLTLRNSGWLTRNKGKKPVNIPSAAHKSH